MRSYATLGSALKMGVKVCYRKGGWIAENLVTGGAIDLADYVDNLALLNRQPVFRFEDQAVIDQLLAEDEPRLAAIQRLLEISALGPQRHVATAGEILDAAKQVFDQVDSPRDVTLKSVLGARFLPSTWPRWRHPLFTSSNAGWSDLVGDDLSAFRTAEWFSRCAAARSISLRSPQNMFTPYRAELRQVGLTVHLSLRVGEASNRYHNLGIQERMLVVPDDPSVPPLHSSFPGLREEVGSYYLGGKPSGASLYFLGAEPAIQRLSRPSWRQVISRESIPVDVLAAAA